MTNELRTNLPAFVPVPDWPSRVENVEISVNVNKVVGSLDLCAMGVDDVFVEGTLVFRGNAYKIKYIHTDDQGRPYGYWYARDEAERATVKDGSSQVRGVIPQDGTLDYALAEAVGGAPKTYVRPLLDAVAATVQRYLVEYAEHATAARQANLVQSINRAASSYNRLAEGAATALAEYEATVKALDTFVGGDSPS